MTAIPLPPLQAPCRREAERFVTLRWAHASSRGPTSATSTCRVKFHAQCAPLALLAPPPTSGGLPAPSVPHKHQHVMLVGSLGSLSAPSTCLRCRFCPADLPPGALPNGAGALCYNSSASCNVGPNACTFAGSAGCTVELGTCSTGQAAVSSEHQWFCGTDNPPGALPAGSGALCYSTASACLTGARAPFGRPSHLYSAPVVVARLA